MSTIYKCPDCGSEVVLGEKVANMLGPFEQIGCNNKEDHDDGTPLAMREVET